MGAGPGWPSETLITMPPHVNCVVISVSVGHGGWGVGEGGVSVGGWRGWVVVVCSVFTEYFVFSCQTTSCLVQKDRLVDRKSSSWGRGNSVSNATLNTGIILHSERQWRQSFASSLIVGEKNHEVIQSINSRQGRRTEADSNPYPSDYYQRKLVS